MALGGGEWQRFSLLQNPKPKKPSKTSEKWELAVQLCNSFLRTQRDGKSRERAIESNSEPAPEHHPRDLSGLSSLSLQLPGILFFFFLVWKYSLLLLDFGDGDDDDDVGFVCLNQWKQLLDQTPPSTLEKVSWEKVMQMGDQVSKQATIGISLSFSAILPYQSSILLLY